MVSFLVQWLWVLEKLLLLYPLFQRNFWSGRRDLGTMFWFFQLCQFVLLVLPRSQRMYLPSILLHQFLKPDFGVFAPAPRNYFFLVFQERYQNMHEKPRDQWYFWKDFSQRWWACLCTFQGLCSRLLWWYFWQILCLFLRCGNIVVRALVLLSVLRWGVALLTFSMTLSSTLFPTASAPPLLIYDSSAPISFLPRVLRILEHSSPIVVLNEWLIFPKNS